MARTSRLISGAAALTLVLSVGTTADAQKRGGVLRMYSLDSPASMSILEEPTVYARGPMMSVFNNLMLFDQHIAQDSLASIVPDLAESWAWSEDGKDLTLKLRRAVKWHDGKPFTAQDVKCTWDLITGQAKEKLRVNPWKSAYSNLDKLETNGDYEVTFQLKRPQPAFPMLLANSFAPIYPCDVPPGQMRLHPIGTGPFKFVEFKPNESIKIARNPDYWEKDRPYLDGIEWTIIKDPSTATLAFAAGKFDSTFLYTLTVPLLNNVKSQVPDAICEMTPQGGINRHLLVNYQKAPFDNPLVRRAMSLALDRHAFINTLAQGEGQIGGTLQPGPEGLWGMPPDELSKLPGYGPDIAKNRSEGRQIMEKFGYGVGRRLAIKVTTRNIPDYRDAAVLLIDQLRHVYIDGELELIDTPQYFPKILRKDYLIGLNLQGSGPDPDPVIALNYSCGSSLNWDGYCNPEIDQMIEQQSVEGDLERRKELVWAIERKLVEDGARPIIFYPKSGMCRQSYVKGLTLMVNSLFNGWRLEDVWLDK